MRPCGRKRLTNDRGALTSQIAILADKLDRNSAGAVVIDPQVDLFKELSGLTESRIKAALALLVCVLIEMGSGLGLFVVLSCARALRDDARATASVPASTPHPLLPLPPDGDWMQARLDQTTVALRGPPNSMPTIAYGWNSTAAIVP